MAWEAGLQCGRAEHLRGYYTGTLGAFPNVSRGDCCGLCWADPACLGYTISRDEKDGNASSCLLKVTPSRPFWENKGTTEGPHASTRPPLRESLLFRLDHE